MRWDRHGGALEARGQAGQAVVIFALVLLTIIAGTGLVLDTGYAFYQRRVAQNAADAAALAGAKYLAEHIGSAVPDAAVVAAMTPYVGANLSGAGLSGWYLDAAGNPVAPLGSGYVIPAVAPGGVPSVSGVQVSVGRPSPTFFMRVVGLGQVVVQASATGRYGASSRLVYQPANGPPILPMIFDASTLSQSLACTGGYSTTPFTFTLDITNPFSCSDKAAGFDWGTLNVCGGCNADSVTKDLLTPNGPYANQTLDLSENIQISGGSRAVNFFNYVSQYWAGQTVIVPLVSHADVLNDRCPNCDVPVQEFAYFHIVSADGKGSPKTLTGYWVDPATMPTLPGTNPATNPTPITGPVTFSLTR
ncbi:MAG TPA: pilus assembly protein TadG-related protein [Isosphaeraceae bacterium]|nr:pilus assembly protein TadG-related protein [Isosphaeraceae bacterium]